jgi:hypothetical protein
MSRLQYTSTLYRHIALVDGSSSALMSTTGACSNHQTAGAGSNGFEPHLHRRNPDPIACSIARSFLAGFETPMFYLRAQHAVQARTLSVHGRVEMQVSGGVARAESGR